MANDIKSVFYGVEMGIALSNSGLMTNPTNRFYYQISMQGAFSVKSDKIIKNYNTYTVRFNPEDLSSSLDFDNMPIYIKREYIDQEPQPVKYYEAIHYLLGIAYKLNLTDTRVVNTDLPIVRFIQDYTPAYLELFTDIRERLFRDFFGEYDKINTNLDLLFILGVTCTILLVSIFVPVVIKFEKLLKKIMSKVSTVDDGEIIQTITRLKQLSATQFNVNIERSFKKGEKSKKNSLKSYEKKGTNYLRFIAITGFVTLSVGSVYLGFSIFYKHELNHALVFMENLRVHSGALPNIGLMIALNLHLINNYDNRTEMKRLQNLYQPYYDSYTTSMHDINYIYHTSQTRVMENEKASETLKERYRKHDYLNVQRLHKLHV